MSTSAETKREEEAVNLLGHTDATRGAERLLITGFALLVLCVAMLQPFAAVWIRRAGLPFSSPSDGPIGFATPARTVSTTWLGRLSSKAARLPSPRDLDRLAEERSAVGIWLRPFVQSILLVVLGEGNARTVIGRDGWLFYRPDLDSITSRAFLAPAVLKSRRVGTAGSEPDPVPAIAHFAAVLRASGVGLVVVPVPTKVSLYAEYLGVEKPSGERLENASFLPFVRALSVRGVTAVDLFPAMMEAKGDVPLYYPRDTHWTTAGIDVAARAVAEAVRPLLRGAARNEFAASSCKYAQTPDIERMLGVEATVGQRECTSLRRPDGTAVHPERGAPVIVVGDSFAMECTQGGANGGLAAALAHELGVEVDLIAARGGGSSRSRLELLRDRGRTNNARVVVLEFSTRDLTFGNWNVE